MSEFKVIQRPLPYCQQLAVRDLSGIHLVVVHCTELPDLAMARAYGERVHYAASQTGNSGHFYIDRDGRCEQWVPLTQIAHHVRGHNDDSIGIELVNRGRYPHWYHSQHQSMTEAYTDPQLASLLALLQQLREQLPELRHIAGHEDLDRDTVAAEDDPRQQLRRKMDPGPLFPWHVILPRSKLLRYPEHPEPVA